MNTLFKLINLFLILEFVHPGPKTSTLVFNLFRINALSGSYAPTKLTFDNILFLLTIFFEKCNT